MTTIHTRLLSILSRLRTSGDRYQRGLAGWVENAHSIDADGAGWRISTADDRTTWYSSAAIERVLADYRA
jgi:hypothetical protein